MPRQYEAIRDKCIRDGGSEKHCKKKAAKIYNAMRNRKPSMPALNSKHKKR